MIEFASANMASSESCTDYVKRIKRIVFELSDCGTSLKQEDVAYTILMGLPRECLALVITLTNMSTPEAPLVLERTIEAIYTKEMRLKLFDNKASEMETNPLAYKHDSQYRGNRNQSQRGAYVARSTPDHNNRMHPYSRQKQPRNYIPGSNDTPLRSNDNMQNLPANDNVHHGKQCYRCGGWNHISTVC